MMKAFENGADGVSVVGFDEGTCHFLTGNLKARKRVEYVKRLLDECGITNVIVSSLLPNSWQEENLVAHSQRVYFLSGCVVAL